MSEAVIQVEGLGKRYRIAPARPSGGGWLRRLPFRGLRGKPSDLWALRDVSFQAAAGEVIGIIGRNGAGKSTLLKILSGVTYPTTGRARMRGRVVSLLEVGTGFHPDLTGRENVYINGALLGMNRAEIRRKFDAIVQFAELERFLDVPIKHLSTGMQMRLAFAVAAHLDGEIMIVDEALSVGDAAFQAKCVQAMSASRGHGRTVLLVSHNVAVLRGLATRAILLEAGRLKASGSVQEVLAGYLTTNCDAASVDLHDHANREGTGEARIERLTMLSAGGESANHTYVGGALHVRLRVAFDRPVRSPQFGLEVYTPEGEQLADLQSRHDGLSPGQMSGQSEVDVKVDSFNLYPGRYLLSAWVADRSMSRILDYVKLCATLVVEAGDPTGRGIQLNPAWGRFFIQSQWCVHKADAAPALVSACL